MVPQELLNHTIKKLGALQCTLFISFKFFKSVAYSKTQLLKLWGSKSRQKKKSFLLQQLFHKFHKSLVGRLVITACHSALVSWRSRV